MITKEQFMHDLREMLGTDEQIEMEMDLLEIPEWDSFSMITFIAMAKDKYQASFEPFAVAEAVLVEDLYSVICESLKGKC